MRKSFTTVKVDPGVTPVGGGGGPALWILDSQPARATVNTTKRDTNLTDMECSFAIQAFDCRGNAFNHSNQLMHLATGRWSYKRS
jgi:hypothetical protein